MTAGLDRTVAPPVRALERMTLPSVSREMLANGTELVVLDHGQQPVNRLMAVWPVGLADVEFPEALRLLRAMLAEGTEHHSGAEIADVFEFNGAWLKVEAGRHFTSVTLHSLNSTAGAVMPLLGEIISSPSFDAVTMDGMRQKEAAACEIRRRKVAQKASELSGRMFYGDNHPLAHVATPELIRSVDSECVRAIHRGLMLSVAPTVYLAGAVDENLLHTVKGIMGQIDFSVTDAPAARRIVPVGRHENSRCETLTDENSMQTAIRIVIPTIGRSHDDYEMMRFTVFALGGYFGSRLMSNIREDKGYTYGINASIASLHEGASVSISCETDNRYASAVTSEIEKEISRLAGEAMGIEEFGVVRSSIMSGLTAMLDSPFSIMDYHQMLDMFGLPENYYAYQLEQLSALTPQKIMECAGRYLVTAPRLTAMAGNPA